MIVFTIFYMIALASTGFFIKYLRVRNIFYLDKESLEKTMDAQIEELDKKEEVIREAYYFIRKLEEEELNIYKQSKDNK
jgi:ribosomal protein L9